MRINTLQPAPNSKKSTKRLGRGIGSGLGKQSGKGAKGQWARSGGGVRPGFEGGVMPLTRRIPKRGFTNKFRVEHAIINLDQLEKFENGAVVDFDILRNAGIINAPHNITRLHILGKGKLTKQLTVKANKFSKSAEEAIKAAGGKIEVV